MKQTGRLAAPSPAVPGLIILALTGGCGGGNGDAPAGSSRPTAINLSVAPNSVAEDAGSVDVTVTATLVGGTAQTTTAVTVSVAGDSAASDGLRPGGRRVDID